MTDVYCGWLVQIAATGVFAASAADPAIIKQV